MLDKIKHKLDINIILPVHMWKNTLLGHKKSFQTAYTGVIIKNKILPPSICGNHNYLIFLLK